MPVREAKTSNLVNVGIASTVLVPENPGRQEITIVVNGSVATDPVFLQLQTLPGVAPTAVVDQGVRLNRQGGSYTTNNFTGAIAAITTTTAVNVGVVEL